jgi:hypothetical protein
MGTLSVLPPEWLASLAAGLGGDAGGGVGSAPVRARVLWVVPHSQRGALPPALRRHTEEWHAEWVASVAECDAGAVGGGDGGEVAASLAAQRVCPSAATMPPAALPVAGDVLLADWVPQVAALMHPAVAAFVSHGGMNSVGDATYARAPLLCIPLFSDQPDNCARIADRGLGVRLVPTPGRGVHPAELRAGMATLLQDGGAPFRDALRLAWAANVAAGGIPRAIQIVEGAAALGYGGHLASVPAVYFLPWWERAGLDVAAVGLLAAWVGWALLGACVRRCGGRGGGAGQRKAKAA